MHRRGERPLWAHNPHIFGMVAMGLTGDYVLQQYTGIVDKNGKKIFEGDIVLIEGVGNFEVYYTGSCFCLAVEVLGVQPLDEFQNLEVIGNIFENPELLK